MVGTQNTKRQTLASPTRRNWIWFSIQCVLRLVFVLWLRYRAAGVEKLPAAGGGLLLINHQSFLDPLLVGLPLSRPVSYLARDSLFNVPVIGWILRKTYVMPIHREAATSSSIKEALGRIEHGFLVGLFPEGTRSADGTVGPLKPGFLALVRRIQVPVYPVGIAGAHEAMPRHAWFPRPRRVRVVFGDPFTPEELEQFRQRGQEAEALAAVRERLVACQQAAEERLARAARGRRVPV